MRVAARWAIPLATLVAAAALAAGAGASHEPAELVSTGPAGGNGPLTAAYAGSSTDGERVFFETLERLVAADTDNRNDVYESASGVTSLVSTGTTGGNGGVDAFFYGASADGASVLFGTSERLTAADTDSASDVYERASGATTLVSTGSTGGNGPQGAFFDGVSADGARVFFHTAERLTAGDTDSQADVYERSGGATALVSTGSSGGNGAFPAFFDGASADGTRVFFDTDERLESGDTDSVQDVYERTGGGTSLVSIGPDGGNGPFPAFFDAASEDGTRVILATDEILTEPDVDASFDVYQRDGGTMSVLVRDGRHRERRLRRPLHGKLAGRPARLLRECRAARGRRHGRPHRRLRAIGCDDHEALGRERGLRRDRSRALRRTAPTCSTRPRRRCWRRTPTPTWTSTTARRRPRSCRPGPPAATDPSMPSLRMSPRTARAPSSPPRRAWSPPTRTPSPTFTSAPAARPAWCRMAAAAATAPFNASFAAASADGATAIFTTSERLAAGDTDSVADVYAARALTGYARPQGASPLRAALVPAYEPCTSPNREHGPPLAFGSCAQPQQSSQDLTVGTPDANGQAAASVGFLRLATLVGNPATPGRRGGRGGVVVDHGRARERGPRRLHR